MASIIDAAVAAEKYRIKPARGSAVRDVGDEVARALRGTGLGYWLFIAERNGCRGHLDAMIATDKNNGQIRMVLGQILRARLRAHKADPDTNAAPFLSTAEPELDQQTPPVPQPGQTPAPRPEPRPDYYREGDADEVEDEEDAVGLGEEEENPDDEPDVKRGPRQE